MSAVVAARTTAPSRERLVLAERVAQLRTAGLTHSEVAAALGISRGWAATLATDPDGSQQLARRAGYRGTCERCGAATDGSSGYDAPRHCATCAAAISHETRRWTAEAVVAAIRRWNDEHGAPPRATDWKDSGRGDGYPAVSSVYRFHGNQGAPFASWADAVEAAGFPRPLVGKRDGQVHWSREVVVAEIQRIAVDGYAAASDAGLRYVAARYFGDWPAACAAAGVKPAGSRPAKWTRETVAAALRERADGPLAPRLRDVDAGLVAAAHRVYGGWPAAVAAAGLVQVPRGGRAAIRARLKAALLSCGCMHPWASHGPDGCTAVGYQSRHGGVTIICSCTEQPPAGQAAR